MSITDEVCRDFEKGDCRRGSRCKYSHPKLQVCRDFQKKKCEREKCRFLHITREEEEAYENSGKLPDHIDEEEGKKKRVMNTSYGGGGQDFGGMYGKRRRDDSFDLISGLGFSALPNTFAQENKMMSDDICRDFERGDCSRGDRCRYSHPKLRVCRDFQKKKCERPKCRFLHITRDEEASYENSGKLPDHIDEEDARNNKVMDGPIGRGAEDIGGMYGKRRRDDNFAPMASLTASSTAVILENEMLKVKITELQRQVMDLHRMNDTLYEQNNTYLTQFRGATGVM